MSRPGVWGTGARDLPPSYADGTDARNNIGVTPDGHGNLGSLDLSDTVFGGRVKTDLIHESVIRANAAERRGTHATKSRGMVSLPGSGAQTRRSNLLVAHHVQRKARFRPESAAPVRTIRAH